MRVEVTETPALAEALERLEAAARERPNEPVILTQADRPVGAYLPLGLLDEEAVRVSLSPLFWEIVRRSRAQHRRGEAQPLEEVLREHGISDEDLARAMKKV